jgi:HAD superfamily hydrolase (TIGR01509 family)
MSADQNLPPFVLNPDGVVFDLDGVLCDTEPLWAEARFAIAAEVGGRLVEEDFHHFYGANTQQWGGAMAKILGHPDADEIATRTIDRLESLYRAGRVQAIPAGVAAVRRAAARGPVAIASGSPRSIIATLIELLGLDDVVHTYVSCDEVAGGKPLPDVYLEACRRIAIAPSRSLAIEDSLAGARAGKAAGMSVVVVPLPGAPSSTGASEVADVVLSSLDELPLAARYP